MKKLNLLVLTPLVIATAGTSVAFANNSSTSLELSTAVTANTNLFFKNTYEIKSTLELFYEVPITFEIFDQVSPSNRVSKSFLYGDLYEELSFVRSAAGHAQEEYISLSNEVELRAITDSEGNPINYDEYYGNPFKSFANLSNSQINSYFDIYKNDENLYVLTANDLAYGALTKSLINFYPELNLYYWDVPSYTQHIEDFVLVLEDDGTPHSMSFTRVKKDRFGGIKEPVSAEFNKISKVETLQPVSPSMNETEANEFKAKLDAFQEKLSEGNFTQEFYVTYNDTPIVKYNTYYSLNVNYGSSLPNMIISDCPLYDANYGQTFVSIVRTTDGYIPYAVSPEAGYEGTMNSTVYTSIDEIIPHVNAMSPDFFSKQNDVYGYDMVSIKYDDVYFSASILTAFITSFDPCVSMLGIYLNNNTYYFDSLYLTFDENDNLMGELNYFANGYSATTAFKFTNVGTTNLEEIESIAPALEFFYL